MPDRKIQVSSSALYQLLQALNGPPHLVHELQATRGLPPDRLGAINPIDQLTEEYNASVGVMSEH